MDDDSPPAWYTDAYRPVWGTGDDVVIDLGECRRIGGLHGTQEQGVRGIVVGVDGCDASHPVAVLFNDPLPAKGRIGYYAPHELRRFDVMAHIAALADETR